LKAFPSKKFVVLQYVIYRRDKKATVPSVATNEETNKKSSKDFQLQLFLRKITACLTLKKIRVFSEVQTETVPTPVTVF